MSLILILIPVFIFILVFVVTGAGGGACGPHIALVWRRRTTESRRSLEGDSPHREGAVSFYAAYGGRDVSPVVDVQAPAVRPYCYVDGVFVKTNARQTVGDLDDYTYTIVV